MFLVAALPGGPPPLCAAEPPAKTLRVYYIGNSVTDTIRYGPFAELAATRGMKIIGDGT